MPATLTTVTDAPQRIRIHGAQTHVDITITFTATCAHGHQHTLHIVDRHDWDQAIDQISDWTNGHLNTCPGPNTHPAAA